MSIHDEDLRQIFQRIRRLEIEAVEVRAVANRLYPGVLIPVGALSADAHYDKDGRVVHNHEPGPTVIQGGGGGAGIAVGGRGGNGSSVPDGVFGGCGGGGAVATAGPSFGMGAAPAPVYGGVFSQLDERIREILLQALGAKGPGSADELRFKTTEHLAELVRPELNETRGREKTWERAYLEVTTAIAVVLKDSEKALGLV